MTERLQKFLARAGVASRRHAEGLITAGRVTVNNERVTELGTKVNPGDLVAVDGRLVEPPEEKSYYVLYKPEGVVTTMEDPQGRPTVADYLREVGTRLFPVGRLDYDAEGALLFTDDGAIANRLTHPKFEVRRTYLAKVKGEPDEATYVKLLHGVRLEDGMARPVQVGLFEKAERNTWIKIVVAEGRPHLIKRLCAAIGHPVLRLFRPAHGGVSVEGMRPGEVRPLTKNEVEQLERIASGEGKAHDGELRLPGRRHGHGPFVPKGADEDAPAQGAQAWKEKDAFGGGGANVDGGKRRAFSARGSDDAEEGGPRAAKSRTNPRGPTGPDARGPRGFKPRGKMAKGASDEAPRGKFGRSEGAPAKGRFGRDDEGPPSKGRFTRDAEGAPSRGRFTRDAEGAPSKGRFGRDDAGDAPRGRAGARDSAGGARGAPRGAAGFKARGKARGGDSRAEGFPRDVERPARPTKPGGRSFTRGADGRADSRSFTRDAEEADPRGGGFKSRGAGFKARGEGGEGRGGYRGRSEGGYKGRAEGAGFKPRGAGGFKPRGAGGFKPRGDGAERGAGGYKGRSEGAGFKPRGAGGFKPRGAGYKPRSEGGDRGAGGYKGRSEGAGFKPRGAGGFKPRGAGGYKPRGEGGDRGAGGYKGRSEGGSGRSSGPRSGAGPRSGSGGAGGRRGPPRGKGTRR